MNIIGEWNPSVILTFVGSGLAVAGMLLISRGQGSYAMLCLIWAAIFDLLDGPVARLVKRSERAKHYGVFIDTVSDVISFVAFPVVLAIHLGRTDYIGCLVYVSYVVFGLSRLADFTLSHQDGVKSTYFTGLPVAYVALIMPLFNLLFQNIEKNLFQSLYTLMMALSGVAFVIPFRNPKPGKRGIFFFSILALLLSFLYLGVV